VGRSDGGARLLSLATLGSPELHVPAHHRATERGADPRRTCDDHRLDQRCRVPDRWLVPDVFLARGKWALGAAQPGARRRDGHRPGPGSRAHHNFAAWSTEGHLAYYVNGSSGAFERAGGQALAVAANPGRVAWLNSGAVVMSLWNEDTPGQLEVVDVTTSSSSVLIPASPGELLDQPALSPDRTRLAYVRRGPAASGEEVWIALADDLDAEILRQVTSHPGDSISWAP